MIINTWTILLIALWVCGAITSIFIKSPEPFNGACFVSLFIGLAYLFIKI